MPYKKPKVNVITKSMDENIRNAMLVALGVTLWMLSGLVSFAEEPKKAAEQQESTAKSVAVQEIKAAPYTESVRLTGIVQAGAEVQLKAQTDGRVTDIIAERGGDIVVNDTLLKLDPEAKKEALKAAKAALKEAESLYTAAKSLNKQGFRADTSLEGQKAQLEAAKQAVVNAEKQLSFTNISAPFNGLADDRMVNVGDFVKSGDTLMTLLDTSSYLIEGFVSQKKHHMVKEGRIATFTLANGETVKGTVEFVANVGDSITRTFRVLVRVQAAEGQEPLQLPVGMSGRINIPTDDEMAVLVPYSALVLNDSGSLGAMIVTEENKAVFKEIDPLADSGEGYYIKNLPEITKLIIRGQNSVRNGDTVQPETLEETL